MWVQWLSGQRWSRCVAMSHAFRALTFPAAQLFRHSDASALRGKGLYDLCQGVVHHSKPVEPVLATLRGALAELSAGSADAGRPFEQCLADALWLLDLETLARSNAEEPRTRFVGLVKALANGVVPREVLERTLEIKLLEGDFSDALRRVTHFCTWQRPAL